MNMIHLTIKKVGQKTKCNSSLRPHLCHLKAGIEQFVLFSPLKRKPDPLVVCVEAFNSQQTLDFTLPSLYFI